MSPVTHPARTLRYGLLDAPSVPVFLDALDSDEFYTPSAGKKQPVHKNLLSHWRGRMGLDKASAQEAYRLLVEHFRNGIRRFVRLPDYHRDENPYESINKMIPV